jgi:hypothetical protein
VRRADDRLDVDLEAIDLVPDEVPWPGDAQDAQADEGHAVADRDRLEVDDPAQRAGAGPGLVLGQRDAEEDGEGRHARVEHDVREREERLLAGLVVVIAAVEIERRDRPDGDQHAGEVFLPGGQGPLAPCRPGGAPCHVLQLGRHARRHVPGAPS